MKSPSLFIDDFCRGAKARETDAVRKAEAGRGGPQRETRGSPAFILPCGHVASVSLRYSDLVR